MPSSGLLLKTKMKNHRQKLQNLNYTGFTLVELLLALMVTSIILTAVASLAFAMGTANQTGDDTSQKQAQLRCATLRISELIRYCKLVYSTSENAVVIWNTDDDGDDEIDTSELVYIEAGANADYISLRYGDDPTKIYLIPQCSNVQFVLDTAAPQTRSVSISFDLEENGATHNYQVNAALRSWAGHLLDTGGNIVEDDD